MLPSVSERVSFPQFELVSGEIPSGFKSIRMLCAQPTLSHLKQLTSQLHFPFLLTLLTLQAVGSGKILHSQKGIRMLCAKYTLSHLLCLFS